MNKKSIVKKNKITKNVSKNKHLPANTELIEKFNEIRNEIGKPMITTKIDRKARRYIIEGKIENVSRGLYSCGCIKDNVLDHTIIMRVSGKGGRVFECNCQGYKKDKHCSHALAVLIYRVINGNSQIYDLKDYCRVARRIRCRVARSMNQKE